MLLVVLLLFGGGKVSGLMGDFAKGIKSFKKNMAEDDDASMEASSGKAGRHNHGPWRDASRSECNRRRPRHMRPPRRISRLAG